MNVSLLIPPAIDWNMPLIALPLLKTYLPSSWNVKIIDINAKLFNSQFGESNLKILKNNFINALELHDLKRAVDTYLDIELHIAAKRIGSSILGNRSLSILDNWFDSNKVFEYLQVDHQIISVFSELLESNIDDNPIDVFGISISIEEQIVPSFIICMILRKKHPDSKIILGGNIVSRLADNLLKSRLIEYFDLLIAGEGEEILQKAIEYIMSHNLNYEKLYYYDEHKTDNLFENLKTPDFSDICWENYISPLKILPITVQRKCKWGKCDFCAIHSCWNYGARERNVHSVVNEIENLIHQYNARFFRIVDEMVSADYLFELSSLLIKRNINIYFEAYVRFEERFLDKEYMKTIYNGGCRQLFWGLENINNDALRFMNKGINRSLIEGCLDASKIAGITNYCFILMGVPRISGETELETLAYVCNNKNIHVGVVGSFVIDKLSPVHVDQNMHMKYGITLFDVGDLTTEVGYLQNGTDTRNDSKHRTAKYIRELYSKRKDFAICSLLSEEVRLILTATFGNSFANDYIALVPPARINELVNRSTVGLIEERVSRRTGEV